MAKHTRFLFMFLIIVFTLAILFFPMRSGIEDTIETNTSSMTLAPGASQRIEYALKSEKEQTIVFSSGNSSIAAVDQTGLVTAIAPGTTEIRLRAQHGATTRVTVTVDGTPVRSFQLKEHELQLNKGDVSGLAYTVNSGATVQNIVWSSDEPEIASVDSLGRVHALSGGETTIRATVPGGLTDSALVHVYVVTNSVQITPSELRVAAGTSYPLQMYFLPDDSTDQPGTWQSSDSRIVTVDADGLMKALKPGNVTVTATSRQGVSGTMKITVDAPVQGVYLNPSSIILERGDETTLETWYIDEYALPTLDVEHHIDWNTSDASCVAVDNGRISAIASGTAVITAVSDNYEAKCVVNVVTSVHTLELAVTEVYMLREQTGTPYQIRASITPEDADDKTLKYTSNNTLVANVDQDGRVTMTGGYGTAVITVESVNGVKATFAVHVVTQLPGR